MKYTLKRYQATLNIGDVAPPLTVKSFVKGKKITQFDPKKIYVVEFWATWCGPCKATIPHLTMLQKQYPQVTFIGVSILEQDQAGVKPFVAQMGDNMGYTVAMDTDVEDKGFMAKSWFQASGEQGIPTTFVVKDGKIAWIGYPTALDKPLPSIIAGKWDMQAEKVGRANRQRRQKVITDLQTKASSYVQSQDWDNAIKTLEAGFKEIPDLEQDLGQAKFMFLLSKGNKEEALKYGNQMVDKNKNSSALNNFAWFLVSDSKDADMYPLGMKTALKAAAMRENKDQFTLDTLAWAYFVTGEIDKAIDLETRVVRIAPSYQEAVAALAKFKKAKQEKK
jgi:thiol-disulfide isomerase/thioredoxin/Tfp pilus assembly protein PilF